MKKPEPADSGFKANQNQRLRLQLVSVRQQGAISQLLPFGYTPEQRSSFVAPLGQSPFESVLDTWILLSFFGSRTLEGRRCALTAMALASAVSCTPDAFGLPCAAGPAAVAHNAGSSTSDGKRTRLSPWIRDFMQPPQCGCAGHRSWSRPTPSPQPGRTRYRHFSRQDRPSISPHHRWRRKWWCRSGNACSQCEAPIRAYRPAAEFQCRRLPCV